MQTVPAVLGLALLDIGQPAEAEIEFRKALELKLPPDQLVPLIALAMNQTQRQIGIMASPSITLSPSAALPTQIAEEIAIAQPQIGHQHITAMVKILAK